MGAYLEREGKSLRTWAAELGISPAYLSDIQNGLRMPRLPLALKLAGELGISPDLFVPGHETDLESVDVIRDTASEA